jgi:hypothetical protein
VIAASGFLLVLLCPAAALSQERGFAPSREIATGDSVKVVAGAAYRAGALQRFLFGAGWRALWVTPIHVPVLDLRGTAGGLRPIERGGGFQTRSLELAGRDGREFRFRSVDKDPSQTLPRFIRWPGIVSMFRDQTSALHPAGALVAASLAETVGIPHVVPRLVVMPDDPALGDFRAEFAGMLGLLEERPAPGAERTPDLFGFRAVLETDSLFPRLRAGGLGGGVDARQYLAARLLDLYLNDWDRHEGNWLWGTRDSLAPHRWWAIPKDRDQVFASYDGLVLGVVRMFVPKLVPFTGDYRLRGLTANARALDVHLLDGLPEPAWDSVAGVLVARMTDAAIERALRAMPEPYYQLSRGELTAKLRERRARLPAAARAWARALADGG